MITKIRIIYLSFLLSTLFCIIHDNQDKNAVRIIYLSFLLSTLFCVLFHHFNIIINNWFNVNVVLFLPC